MQARRIAAYAAGLIAVAAIGGELPPAGIGVAAGPPEPSVVVPLEPARILDTRNGVGAPAAVVGAGQTITLQVSGAGAVPVGASGVLLNLTVTAADRAGYVTAFPSGGPRPEASVINYTGGEDVANMVTAQLSADGKLDLFNDQGNVHLLADVAGYLLPGAGAPGPAGPQGPAGLQGPGPDVIDDVTAANGTKTVWSSDGVEVVLYCESNPNQVSLAINSTPVSAGLRASGVMGRPGDVPQVVSLSQQFAFGPNDDIGAHFSGLVQNATVGGRLLQMDIGVRHGNPCTVIGSVLPLG